MELYSLRLKGFRRFRDAKLNLQGPAIAVLGPNEVGKSTLFEALRYFNTDTAIAPTALSRGTSPAPDDELLVLRFRLNDEERSRCPIRLAKDEGIWLQVAKTVRGRRVFRLDPPAIRDLRPREIAAKAVVQALEEKWVQEWRDEGLEQADSSPVPSVDLLERLATELDSEVETLPGSAIERLEAATEAVAARTSQSSVRGADKKSAESLRRSLAAALELEQLPSPVEWASSLAQYMPVFVEFTDDVRSLRSEYNLGDKGDFENPALRNLAALADLSLVELRDAMTSKNPGLLRSILEEAQETLSERIDSSYHQSPVAVSFDPQQSVLGITIRTHGRDYFKVAERSAGLQAFVALHAFLAEGEYAVPPILLVDEAENHLHYDAQADMVDLFEQQDGAAQIIYTTHSIGCLPSDLGRGIRVIRPADGMTSTAHNSWMTGSVGAIPLAEMMGAATVPLSLHRYMVVAEGPSDAMLYPTLLREATGLATLGYQIVPGLAEASNDELSRLALNAPRVAYLVDGDQSGRETSRRLLSLGVPADRIISLAPVEDELVLEDLIDPGLYRRAVMEYLNEWPPHAKGLEPPALPSSGRTRAVRTWCEENRREEPSHSLVADEVLRLVQSGEVIEKSLEPGSHPIGIVDPDRIDLLVAVHNCLLRAVGLEESQDRVAR